MNLRKYLGKKISVTDKDGSSIGVVVSVTDKHDTDDELYDELTIQTDDFPYVTFPENTIKSIELKND